MLIRVHMDSSFILFISNNVYTYNLKRAIIWCWLALYLIRISCLRLNRTGYSAGSFPWFVYPVGSLLELDIRLSLSRSTWAGYPAQPCIGWISGFRPSFRRISYPRLNWTGYPAGSFLSRISGQASLELNIRTRLTRAGYPTLGLTWVGYPTQPYIVLNSCFYLNGSIYPAYLSIEPARALLEPDIRLASYLRL